MELITSNDYNNEVFKIIQISSQEMMIIKSIEKFYENEDNVNLFISIVKSDSKISIRLIDYFITKYSRNHKINYKITENNIENNFNVFTSYKQQLKAFQKRHFDPFSRGIRIPYFLGNTCVITTIGQLNFFKWFISKNIYNFIENNKLIIENSMNRRNKNEHKKKINKQHVIKTKKITNSNICNPYKPNNVLSSVNNNGITVSFSFI